VTKIAVIAGSGDLPFRIIEKLSISRIRHVVLSISPFGPESYEQFDLGEIGRMLAYIRSKEASKVVFCGSIRRPSFFSLKMDRIAKKWLMHLGVRAFLGDDTLLKGIRRLAEAEGLEIISPQIILESLLTPQGLLTKIAPSEADLQDIARGVFVLNTLAKADVGQAVIVQEGIVLGIEAAEGTKELLARCKHLKVRQCGGVLVKISKTQQDLAFDLPTIGEQTVIDAEACELSGIALDGNNSQIIDFEKTIKLANEKEMFVLGL
jgi:DUF1009 family protein